MTSNGWCPSPILNGWSVWRQRIRATLKTSLKSSPFMSSVEYFCSCHFGSCDITTQIGRACEYYHIRKKTDNKCLIAFKSIVTEKTEKGWKQKQQKWQWPVVTINCLRLSLGGKQQKKCTKDHQFETIENN